MTDLATLVALMKGDRWLNADAAAIHLGLTNRRAFLERIACMPDFPAPMKVGGHRAWRKSELDEWAEARRK